MHVNDQINILMVDDQPSKLLSYEAILGGLDARLIKAHSAKEALEHLLKTEVAVVLMDVSMPELDGFELAEMIRQHPRYQKTAIIFVSAVHLTAVDLIKGYERGAVDYVTVPVVPEILRAKVSVFVDLYRKTRELERLNRELEERVRERTEELERKAAELQALNDELVRSNRDLDAFAYIASHDLKEPLRGIHNYSHFLLEDYQNKLDEKGVEQLETLSRLTQRMETLIDSLLHYSRVGRNSSMLREVDLNKVLDESLELLSARLKENNATVTRAAALPSALADPTCVGEVFSNLISNAIKYNNKPEKLIEVGYLEQAEAGPTSPVYYVRDNGIGIAAKHHESIFHIFKRLHGRDQYGGGVGAGLTIVRKIVERHGGRIWLESAPGEGTTFFFTLARGSKNHAQEFVTAHSID